MSSVAVNGIQETTQGGPPVSMTLTWNRDQVDLVKRTVAKGATDDELKMFLYIANKYNLDPFTKEIWFIKRPKKQKDAQGNWDYKRTKDGEIDYTGADTVIMTSRDGYLKAAQADPDYDGLQSFVVREGDVFEIDAERFKVNHKFGGKRGPILGAWAAAMHKKRRPAICFVEFKEYNDTRSSTWQNYPSAMIQKVAEVFVLRRQFNLSGLVSREELAIREAEDAEHSAASAIALAQTPRPAAPPAPAEATPQPEAPAETPAPASGNGAGASRWRGTLASARNMHFSEEDVLREAKAFFNKPDAESLDDIMPSPHDMTEFVLYLKSLQG